MFDLLDAAGVPAVDTLRDALPAALESKVEGWMNDALAAAGIADELDLVIAQAQRVLTSVELASDLTIASASTTDAASAATHAPRALHWAEASLPGGAIDVTIPLDAALDPVLAAPLTAQLGSAADGSAQLSLGAHAFGLAYGEYAWRALNALMRERSDGLDLRAQLGAIADCPAIAASVAAKCVLSVCVGHASDLEAILRGRPRRGGRSRPRQARGLSLRRHPPRRWRGGLRRDDARRRCLGRAARLRPGPARLARDLPGRASRLASFTRVARAVQRALE